MKTSLRIFILMLSFLPLGSCMKDDSGDEAPGGEEKDVMLKLSLPYAGLQKPVTRAMDANGEIAVDAVDVLAFKVDDNGAETFLYRVSANEIGGGDAPKPNERDFTVKLRLKDYRQRFVIIANAHSQVETLIGSRVPDGWVGVEKEAMLSLLTFNLNGDDRWTATDAANFTRIPMWGESEPVVVKAGFNTLTPGNSRISLLRMVAKIEVALDESKASETTGVFKLKSLYLYNINTTGRIVPVKANIGTDNVAQRVSLPDKVASKTGPIEYSGADKFSAGIMDVAMRGAVYLFETAAKNKGNQLEETCIVVGGFYDKDVKETYYRLDFFADDGKTHSDILRNHNYECWITAVKGPGEVTVDKAYRSKTLNMKTQVLVWDDGAIRDVNIDGQNFLGVSQSRFEFDCKEHGLSATDNILKINTDVPGGWKADVHEDKNGTKPVPMDWIKLDRYAGTGGSAPEELRLLIAPNSGETPRTAWIRIKAGRLIYLVEVKQS